MAGPTSMNQNAVVPAPKVRAGPSGIHVFDRTTGMNLLIDEARVPERLWSKAPRNVSIALTNACDLSCDYCYAPKQPATLATKPLCDWLIELDIHGCLGVGFGGGEPTLYRQLPELCQFVTDSTGMAATLTTHGHRLDERLAADLRGNVHFIRVSMDGVGAVYERQRRRSFDTLLTKLSLVRTLAPFGINFVVNADTLPDLGPAIALAEKLGAAEFLLLPEQPVRDRGGIDERSQQSLEKWVASYRGFVRLAVSEAGAGAMPTCDPLRAEAGTRAYAHIDARGVLKQSSYSTFGLPIGAGGILDALRRLQNTSGLKP